MTPEQPPEWTGEKWTDLGSGVWSKPLSSSSGESVGWLVGHYHPDGKWCMGSVPRMGSGLGGDEWEVLQEEPLTLNPSISQKSGPGFTECLHGYIREGRWVDV